MVEIYLKVWGCVLMLCHMTEGGGHSHSKLDRWLGPRRDTKGSMQPLKLHCGRAHKREVRNGLQKRGQHHYLVLHPWFWIRWCYTKPSSLGGGYRWGPRLKYFLSPYNISPSQALSGEMLGENKRMTTS